MEIEGNQIVKKAGRPKNSPNRCTAIIRQALGNWLESEIKNIPALYKRLPDRDKAKFLTNILPFVAPRMKEVDLSITELPQDSIDEIISRLLDGEYN